MKNKSRFAISPCNTY